MTEIKKSITRAAKDRKSSLILYIPEFVTLSIIAFFIILGLELYFLNTTQSEETIHLAGPFSIIFGILLYLSISNRRRSLKNYHNWVKRNGGQITEILTIDAHQLSHETVGYLKYAFSWNSLSKYKEHKKHIEVVIAGLTFKLPHGLLDEAEHAFLLELIKSKSSFQPTPPPLPQGDS